MKRLLALFMHRRLANARVRRTVIAQSEDVVFEHEESLLESARRAMPPGYDVESIHEYREIDVQAAARWMNARYAQRSRYRYLPLLGRDCFTFARDALLRAGAPVLLWELYLQRADGAARRFLVNSTRGEK